MAPVVVRFRILAADVCSRPRRAQVGPVIFEIGDQGLPGHEAGERRGLLGESRERKGHRRERCGKGTEDSSHEAVLLPVTGEASGKKPLPES